MADVGQKFGKLTVIQKLPKGVNLCRCECGSETKVSNTRLPKSTGCRECNLERLRSEKWSDDPAYKCWASMKTRCLNRNHKHYDRYGGRGIKVCDRWVESFQSFLEDMGERPSPNHTIERINHDGDYEPSNCKWMLRRYQNDNTSRTRDVSVDGMSFKTLSKAATHFGIPMPHHTVSTKVSPRGHKFCYS